jgi:hypothetical protein
MLSAIRRGRGHVPSGGGVRLTYKHEMSSRLGSFKSKARASPVAGRWGSSPASRVVGTSNAVIDFGVQSVGAGGLPHAGDCAEAFLQHGCRRAGRHQQLRVESALHVPRARPAPRGRGRALRRGSPRHGRPQRPGVAFALRPLPSTHGKLRGFERTCSSWEPSWARWRSRFSACEASCFSAGSCHLVSLQKRGACPHRRTGLQKTIVFKNLCPLVLSSREWRSYHEYASTLEPLCRE